MSWLEPKFKSSHRKTTKNTKYTALWGAQWRCWFLWVWYVYQACSGKVRHLFLLQGPFVSSCGFCVHRSVCFCRLTASHPDSCDCGPSLVSKRDWLIIIGLVLLDADRSPKDSQHSPPANPHASHFLSSAARLPLSPFDLPGRHQSVSAVVWLVFEVSSHSAEKNKSEESIYTSTKSRAESYAQFEMTHVKAPIVDLWQSGELMYKQKDIIFNL